MSKRLSTRIVRGDVFVTFPKNQAVGAPAALVFSATFFIVSKRPMSHHLQFQGHCFLQQVMRGFLDQEEGLHAHGADPDIQDAAGTNGQVRDRVQAEGPRRPVVSSSIFAPRSLIWASFMLSSTVS